MIQLSKLVNSKDFKESFKSVYRDFEIANENVSEYYRDKSYQFMFDKIQKAYSENRHTSYIRTYALRDTLEAPMGKSPLGDSFTIGWNEKRSKFSAVSIWGTKIIDGTHRTFFGSSSYGLSVGDKVPVPIVLNEMKIHNVTQRQNPFFGFIDETEDYIRYKLLTNHKKHFMDFFEL